MTAPERSRSRSSISVTSLKMKSLSSALPCSSTGPDECYRVDEDEIETQCDALRKKLTAEMNGSKSSGRGLKSHQVHELAAAKIEESEKLRKALGIRKDYEEGSHWKKQEERLRDATLERGKEDARKEIER